MLVIPLTPEQFQAKKAQVEAELNQSLDSKQGTIEHDGVKLSYTYDGSNLAVNVVKKPMLVPASVVADKIKQWFTT